MTKPTIAIKYAFLLIQTKKKKKKKALCRLRPFLQNTNLVLKITNQSGFKNHKPEKNAIG